METRRRSEMNAAFDPNVGSRAGERSAPGPAALVVDSASPTDVTATSSAVTLTAPISAEDDEFRPVLERALGHRYGVLGMLGRGGMGAVYLVLDRHHDRHLALKVVLPEIAAALGTPHDADRFLREIRISAHLSHPHIVALYDSGQAEGLLYYTMPYVPGESLRERLRRERQLPLGDAITLARQVGAALDYAHRQGVIHRDVKPENILLHEGEALIADFGIARALRRDGMTARGVRHEDEIPDGQDARPGALGAANSASTLSGEYVTAAGLALGTPLYMSPEQAAGEPVDGRSDIYALGCVVYEMLTGEPPFTGPNANVILARKLTLDLPPLSGRQTELPASLDEVIREALRPVPAERFTSAEEFVRALERGANAPNEAPSGGTLRMGRAARAGVLATTVAAVVLGVAVATRDRDATELETAPPGIRAIAVLPLDDTSHAGIADDVHARLVAELERVSAIRVTGAASASRYRGSAKSPVTIAKELNVDALVESFLTVGHDSLSLQLRIRGGIRGEPLWMREYAIDIRHLQRLPKDITRDVVAYLQLPLTDAERRRLARYRTADPRANEAYLRGRRMSVSLDPNRFRKSVDAFEEAIRLDPDDPAAYVGLAEVYESVGFGHYPMDLAVAFGRAKELVQRALELDPDNAEAHVILGGIRHMWEWDWEGADREFRLAIRNSPGSAQAHLDYGAYLQFIGLIDSALVELRRAANLDPLSTLALGQLGWAHLWAGNADSTFYWVRRALDLEPNFAPARWILGSAYMAKGQHDSSIAANRQAAAITPHFRIRLAVAYAAAGRRRDFERTLASLTEAQRLWAVLRASPFVGDREEAIRTMKAAIDAHLSGLGQLRGDPAYEHLASDPRYQALLRRIGLPPRPLAAQKSLGGTAR